MSVSELSAFHVLVIGAANVRYVRRSRFDGCRIADMRHMRPLVGYLKIHACGLYNHMGI